MTDKKISANNIMMEIKNAKNNKYELFTLHSYSHTKKALLTPNLLELDEIVYELNEYDNDYHFRIHPKTQYTFFSDVDGIDDFDDYITKLIEFLKKYYSITVDIDEDDISYTKNNGKDGSYHISIPKLNASTEKLKEIHENFKETCYDKKSKFIDTSIYSEHWFRYPNQSKEGDDTQIHRIVEGEIIDFVAEYIKSNSYNMNENKFIKKSNTIDKLMTYNEEDIKTSVNNNNNIQEIKKLLDQVDYNKYINREDWLYFGSILKNMGLDYNLFCEYSQKMMNQTHEPCRCESVFKSLKKKINNPIGILKQMIKSHNLENKECVDMKELIDYFNDKSFNDIDTLLEDIKNKCKNTIFIFQNGAEEYIAIKKDYNYENDIKINELSKFEKFEKNYKFCTMKYKQLDEETEKVKNKKISLPDAIHKIPDLSYKGYFNKPYHPFENNNINVNGYLNMFSPMIAKRLLNYDISKIEMIINHIKEVWANNDDFLLKYIMSYFHQIIKTPWNKTDVCIVLNGIQGCGKSIIIDKMIEYIFGDNCGHQTRGLKRVIARFNSWIENKLLILSEEPTMLNDQTFSEYVETLKDFITGKQQEIEKKGIDHIEKPKAYHNLIITCNHTKGIHIDDKDRRFLILECDKKYVGNTNYFIELTKVLDNKDNMNIFFNYLYDYNDVIQLQPVPITKLKEEMIHDNMTVYEKFLFHKECRYEIYNSSIELTPIKLYEKFSCWYDYMGLSKTYKPSQDKVFKELSKFGKSKQVRDKQDKTKKYYIYEFNEETIAKIKKIDDI